MIKKQLHFINKIISVNFVKMNVNKNNTEYTQKKNSGNFILIIIICNKEQISFNNKFQLFTHIIEKIIFYHQCCW